MYNKNAAYDFKAFEVKKPVVGKVINLPDGEVRNKVKIQAQKILLISFFSMFLAIAGGVSGFVYGQAKLTEVTDNSVKALKELEQYKSINTELSMKLEGACYNENSKMSGFENDSAVEIVKIHKGDIAKIN